MVLRLQGIVTTIDQGEATIELEDSQVLKIPVRDLTPAPTVGDTLTLTVLPTAEAKLSQDELARTLLSQLIRDVQSDQKGS